MDSSVYERNYEDLFYTKPEKFKLMENSANALLLQFKEPIKYDLTIPSVHNIKRLLHIFQDGFNGEIINPSRVDCCYPSYYTSSIKLDFDEKYSKSIQEGLELCFGLKDKYDLFPLSLHLKLNESLFGNELDFYRFREGKKQEVENSVKDYFSKYELNAFEEIGNFMQPYVKNLNRPYTFSGY